MAEKDFVTKSFEKAASGLDAADKKFVSKTEGGVPQTKAEEIVAKNTKEFLEPYAEGLRAIPQFIGNALLPGKPFGKDNPFIASQSQLDARALELQNMKAYREKRDMSDRDWETKHYQ